MAVRENKIFIPNAIHFITFTILGWRIVFYQRRYVDLVYKWFDYMNEKYGNEIYGYVIMPNHIHCLIRITDKAPKLPVLIANAKRFLAYGIVDLLKEDNNINLLNFFAKNARVKDGARHKIFEDRYDSLPILSEEFFFEKLNYIHKNPCQKKWYLADDPEKYLYSSASNYFFGHGVYPVTIYEM